MVRTSLPTSNQVRLAYTAIAIGGFLFTFDLPLLRLSLSDKWTMVFTRGIFLFLSISFMWWVARRRSNDAAPYIAGLAGVIVAVSSTIANIAYIGAIVETGAASVVFILALTPLITAAMSWVVLGERVHAWTWLATFVAFGGVGIIAWDGLAAGTVLGEVLALLSAFCSATTLTIIRATGRNVSTSLAVGSLSSALIALVFFQVSLPGLLLDGSFGVPAWVWIALNGLLTIPLASILLANGPRVLPSADVSMFFMLETVLTPVWIWLLFGEFPGRMVLTGGLIVIFTLGIHSWWRLNQSLRPATGGA